MGVIFSTMWILAIKLRLSGLAVSIFAPHLAFCVAFNVNSGPHAREVGTLLSHPASSGSSIVKGNAKEMLKVMLRKMSCEDMQFIDILIIIMCSDAK